jgi:hypothetical protein
MDSTGSFFSNGDTTSLSSLAFNDEPLLVSDDNTGSSAEKGEGRILFTTDEENSTLLPIDEHKDEILLAVKNQRVTIIHGETGKTFCF